MAMCDCPTRPYFHERERCVLRHGRLGEHDLCKDEKQLFIGKTYVDQSKGHANQSPLALPLWIHVQVFRREIKGFIAEICVRNQSTKPCCLKNRVHTGPSLLEWLLEKQGQG